MYGPNDTISRLVCYAKYLLCLKSIFIALLNLHKHLILYMDIYIFLQSSALIEADDIDTSNVAELEVSLLYIIYQLNKNIGIF